MYALDYYDILFFVKSLKYPSNHFNLWNHVTFGNNRTRSTATKKLMQTYSPNNKVRNFYFNHYLDCGMPSLLSTLIYPWAPSSLWLTIITGITLQYTLTLIIHAHTIFFAPAIIVVILLPPLTLMVNCICML